MTFFIGYFVDIAWDKIGMKIMLRVRVKGERLKQSHFFQLWQPYLQQYHLLGHTGLLYLPSFNSG
jgi:hypothetical protein